MWLSLVDSVSSFISPLLRVEVKMDTCKVFRIDSYIE